MKVRKEGCHRCQPDGLVKGTTLVFGRLRKRCQVFFDATLVDPQELVSTCGHIDVVRLSLRSLFVHEHIDRIILGHCFDQAVHDLEQRLTQRC